MQSSESKKKKHFVLVIDLHNKGTKLIQGVRTPSIPPLNPPLSWVTTCCVVTHMYIMQVKLIQKMILETYWYIACLSLAWSIVNNTQFYYFFFYVTNFFGDVQCFTSSFPYFSKVCLIQLSKLKSIKENLNINGCTLWSKNHNIISNRTAKVVACIHMMAFKPFFLFSNKISNNITCKGWNKKACVWIQN